VTGDLVVAGLSRSTVPEVLLWAVEEAALRGGRVRVVRAWRPGPSSAGARGTPSAVLPSSPESDEVAARDELDREVSTLLGPDHDVEVVLVRGGRRRVLLAQSAEADLLVIAAPRLTSASDAPLQVARLVQDSACPVVVLPRKVTGEGDSLLMRSARVVAGAIARSAGEAGRPGVRPPASARPD
jgi:hypothetical protein